MEKPAKTVNPYIFNLGMIVLTLLLFLGWNHLGWQLVMNQHLWIQWQTLPAPPSPIVELLPPWGEVRLRSENGTIYSLWAGLSVDKSWEVEEHRPPIDDELQPLSTCDLADVPFSYSLAAPESSQQCYPYRIGPHSPPSYIVRDAQEELWVWVNPIDPNSNIIYLCLIFLSGLVVTPLMSFWIMRWLLHAKAS